jgi:DNA-binding MarR family transcriptional regulator
MPLYFGFLGICVARLTARQMVFCEKLLELYREVRGPVHYSELAKRLGVNRFSAYDMLKVLEKKGFASSSYALDPAHSGPGRPMVVFEPTAQAARLSTAFPDLEPEEEWQTLRARVLGRLRQARGANVREALSELLARLPEAGAPLTYCTEMTAALLLNMKRVGTRAVGLSPFRALAALRSGGATDLEALAGLSVGATLVDEDETSTSLTQRLLDHARRYQANLGRLSEDARAQLVQFLEEALEALD